MVGNVTNGGAVAGGDAGAAQPAAQAKTLQLWVVFAVVVPLLALEIIIISIWHRTDSAITQATLFAVITGSAVGIERALEFGWTVVGLRLGPWWPIVKVSDSVKGLL